MKLILASLVVGLIWGGVQAVQVLQDPAGTIPQAVLWGAWPIPVCGGLGCVASLALFIRSNRNGPATPKPDPANPPVIITPSIPATTMELHNEDIDIHCVLRGEAETDAEGLKRIGAVLDYYASRKGSVK